MKVEEIGDPIRVLAVFAGGGIQPMRFGWNGRTYRIDRINAQWIDRQCDGYVLHYSVQVGQEAYAIHFASADVQWWLDQVAVEG